MSSGRDRAGSIAPFRLAWVVAVPVDDRPIEHGARGVFPRRLGVCGRPGARRLKSAPEDVPALQLLARASVRLGRDSVATAIYQRLGSLAPTAEDLYLQGLVLSRSDKPRRAVATWEHARTLDPDHPETLLELTRDYRAAAASTNAEQVGTALATHHGWESHHEAMLGMIQLERNDPAGAAAYWLRALGRAEVVKDGVPRPIVPPRNWRSPGCERGDRAMPGTNSASSWPRSPIPKPTGS